MSNIATLRNNWESLAKRDAFHAILTDETKVGGKWSIAEFMSTGTAEIDMVMRHLAGLGYIPECGGTALDFGCGVGRLTQALGGRFASCVGVDISQAMIEKAESINQSSNCRYLTNSNILLPFPEGTFSFIYSNIVLQHIPTRFAKEYLHEFVRVLWPGGILVFGVQDSFAAPTLAALAIRVQHVVHLRSRVKELLRIGPGDMQMHCLPGTVVRSALGSARIVDIQFTNTAAKNFNGKLTYLPHAPASGYIGKQYCVVK
jgi:ubiquinone/menaquinone biosynthesis C-methylase UbiE